MNGSSVSTKAFCWHAVRKDGAVYAFTTHVRDLLIDAVTFKAASAFSPSEVQTRNDSSVDNLELIGLIASDTITEADLLSGKWDFATVHFFAINYLAVTDLKESIKKGTLGQVSRQGARFRAELRGLAQYLQTPIGIATSITCRYEVGDAECGVNMAPFTFVGAVTAVNGQIGFTDSSRAQTTPYFDFGELTWTSGNNNTLKSQVRRYLTGGVFTLLIPVPFSITIGDTYSVKRGCNKVLLGDCKLIYNNAVVFGGEPYIPGIDEIVQIGRHGA